MYNKRKTAYLSIKCESYEKFCLGPRNNCCEKFCLRPKKQVL